MERKKQTARAFKGCHPMVSALYFLFVISIAMFSNHPAFLAIAFFGALINSIFFKGKQAVKTCCLLFVPVFIIVPLINALNVHKGVTVLFYLNDNAITLEACVYGMVQAVLLSGIILWFVSINEIMSSDKWIYLIGRKAPGIGLLVSMVLRFVPMLKRRYEQIHQAQICMGRKSGIRQFFKECSILIAWSLESSIDTSDSMEARGYGLKGRSSYHLFRWEKRDTGLLASILIFGGVGVGAVLTDRTDIWYYPKIVFLNQDGYFWIALAAYGILCILPLVLEVIERECQHGFVQLEKL